MDVLFAVGILGIAIITIDGFIKIYSLNKSPAYEFKMEMLPIVVMNS
ncbi:hypothetical protein ACFWGC_26915 [Cytobacillus pseudoceanisediminis]